MQYSDRISFACVRATSSTVKLPTAFVFMYNISSKNKTHHSRISCRNI